MIRLTHLLNEVKQNHIYITGLTVIIPKVCECIPDTKKALLLAQMVRIEECAQQINHLPYNRCTSGQMFYSVETLKMALTEMRLLLADLLSEHGENPERRKVIQNALMAVMQIYDC